MLTLTLYLLQKIIIFSKEKKISGKHSVILRFFASLLKCLAQ